MTWVWKGEGMEPLPGVPGRDLTDEEFVHYAAEYDAQFEPGALASCPLYEHIADKPGRKEKVNDASNEGESPSVPVV